jgi:hypothetical protein
MNFLSMLCRHARALVLTALQLPSILLQAWKNESARWPQSESGGMRAWYAAEKDRVIKERAAKAKR